MLCHRQLLCSGLGPEDDDDDDEAAVIVVGEHDDSFGDFPAAPDDGLAEYTTLTTDLDESLSFTFDLECEL